MTKYSLAFGGLLAATLAIGPAMPALSDEPARLENSLTAGGLNIAPRYLDHVGDVDLNLLAGYVHFPGTGGGLFGGQVSIQSRLLDQVQLLANIGPLTEIALRGPLWLSPSFDLGWDARYRNEHYFANTPGLGLNAALLPTLPGASAQGPEVKLNAAAKWNDFQVFLSPLAAKMTNRNVLGLEGGLDWNWQSWSVGYSIAHRARVSGPDPDLLPSETQHGFGVRYSLNERTFLQANLYVTPANPYGTDDQTLLLGFGQRLLDTFKPPRNLQALVDLLPLPKSAPRDWMAPLLAATPAPEVTPLPVALEPDPEPEPEEAPMPEPARLPSLSGRIVHSLLPNAEPGIPVKLELKRRTNGGFVLIPETTVTTPDGRFAFPELTDGDYQLVYRDHSDLPDTPALLVSDAVTVKEGSETRLVLDLAWKFDAAADTQPDGSDDVRWAPLKDDTVYQVLVNQDGKNILAFPDAGTPDSRAQIALPHPVRQQQPQTFIKFWKKGDAFLGNGYYGQSRPIPVESARQPQEEEI